MNVAHNKKPQMTSRHREEVPKRIYQGHRVAILTQKVRESTRPVSKGNERFK